MKRFLIFLWVVFGMSAINAQNTVDLREISPFRLGMHCSEVEEVMKKMLAGDVPDFKQYRVNRSGGIVSRSYSCVSGEPRALSDNRPLAHGFNFSITALHPLHKHRLSVHEVTFDRGGRVISINMQSLWSELDRKPTIASLRSSLLKKYGKPLAVLHSAPGDWDDDGGEMVWGTSSQEALSMQRLNTVELGKPDEWQKIRDVCNGKSFEDKPELRESCAMYLYIDDIQTPFDTIKANEKEVLLVAGVSRRLEKKGMSMRFELTVSDVLALDEFKRQEDERVRDRVKKLEKDLIPKF